VKQLKHFRAGYPGIALVALLAFILMMVSCGSASAAVELEYYGIEDTIQEDGSIINSITLKFSAPINHLDYQLGFKIYNLSVEQNFDSADCRAVDAGERSTVSCDFMGMTRENNQLKLVFDTKDGVKKVGRKQQFIVNYGVSLPIERAFILLKLPEKSVLTETPVNMSYTPSDGKTLTDGKHIMVYWERLNLTSGDDLQFSVMYSAAPEQAPVSNSLVAALTAVVIVAMVGVGMFVKRGPSGAKTETAVITSVLNTDEKAIVDILSRNSGSAVQKVLVRESDFSKAKVSRLVKSLKDRGVIDVEPVSGRENRIILKLKHESAYKSGQENNHNAQASQQEAEEPAPDRAGEDREAV
jgi:uncharacterized membrane protein